jgi:hypothetical protein
MACLDTILIGNLPTSLISLSRHVFRRGAMCPARP